MGFYTSFRIETVPTNWFSQETDQELEDLTGYHLNDVTSGYFSEEIKWYGNHNDMVEFTARHPDVFITLEGIGEDGCRWQRRYNNGEMVAARYAYTMAPDDPQPIWAEWGAGIPNPGSLRSATNRLIELYNVLGVDPGSADAQDKALAVLALAGLGQGR